MSEEIGVRRAALRDGGLGDRVVEAAAAVADVEDHAALLRRQRGRQQLAVLHDVRALAGVVRRARVAVRQHVAGAQQVEQLRHQRAIGDAADVAHHLGRHARQLAGADRALQRLGAVARDHVLAHPHLDAEHDVGVLGDRPRGRLRLRIVDVEELRHRKAGEPGDRDVHERVLARARGRHDEAPERREVVRAGIARRHHGRRALMGDELVGRDADRRAVRVRCGNAGRSGPASPACRRRPSRGRRARRRSSARSTRSGRSGCRCRACRTGSGSGRARWRCGSAGRTCRSAPSPPARLRQCAAQREGAAELKELPTRRCFHRDLASCSRRPAGHPRGAGA